MRRPTEKPEPVTKEEYAERRRIQEKIDQVIWWDQIECHSDSAFCTKCGAGFP